jgi:hypothetical protein
MSSEDTARALAQAASNLPYGAVNNASTEVKAALQALALAGTAAVDKFGSRVADAAALLEATAHELVDIQNDIQTAAERVAAGGWL